MIPSVKVVKKENVETSTHELKFTPEQLRYVLMLGIQALGIEITVPDDVEFVFSTPAADGDHDFDINYFLQVLATWETIRVTTEH